MVLETQAHPRLKPLLNPSQSATFSLILSSQRSKIQIRETEVVLMNFLSKTCSFFCLLAFLSTTIFTPAAHAENNQVLGEIELVGASKVEKTFGVWLDGQIRRIPEAELKGSKKLSVPPWRARDYRAPGRIP